MILLTFYHPYFKCSKKDYDEDCTYPKLRLQEPEIEVVIWKCIVQELAKEEEAQSIMKRIGLRLSGNIKLCKIVKNC